MVLSKFQKPATNQYLFIQLLNISYFISKFETRVLASRATLALKPAIQTDNEIGIWPEIFLHFNPDTKLFLWQMRECKNVVTMELAERPVELDFTTSIDPYCFMELQEYN